MNEKNLQKGLKPSKIRELFEYSNTLKQKIGANNVYDFSIGNPYAPVPQTIKEEIGKIALSDKNHGYTSTCGDQESRQAIANFLNTNYGSKFKDSNIFLTCGASSALAISFNALLNENDEVILFVPFFPEYPTILSNLNVKIVLVNPDPNTIEPDLNDLKNKITNKTKLVIIDTPNNPSGVLYKEGTIKAISSILEEKQNEYGTSIYLLSDEPYRELIYSKNCYPFITNFYRNSIITYSFSKVLSMPGDRIGYIAINPEADEAENFMYACVGASRTLGYVCAPTIFQKLIPHMLGITSDFSIYKEGREILLDNLQNIGYQVICGEGAFYLLLKTLEEDANKFSDRAKTFNLIVVPTDPFGLKGYVRLSYALPIQTIKNSIKAFKDLYNSYGDKK